VHQWDASSASDGTRRPLRRVRQDVRMANTVGAGTVVLTEVVRNAISHADLERMVSHRRAGAVVSFVGTVRDHDHDRSVIDLE